MFEDLARGSLTDGRRDSKEEVEGETAARESLEDCPTCLESLACPTGRDSMLINDRRGAATRESFTTGRDSFEIKELLATLARESKDIREVEDVAGRESLEINEVDDAIARVSFAFIDRVEESGRVSKEINEAGRQAAGAFPPVAARSRDRKFLDTFSTTFGTLTALLPTFPPIFLFSF
jgi:hypothetical protein